MIVRLHTIILFEKFIKILISLMVEQDTSNI